MTVPFERTRALVQTKQFLEALMDPTEAPRVSRWIRDKLKRCCGITLVLQTSIWRIELCPRYLGRCRRAPDCKAGRQHKQ